MTRSQPESRPGVVLPPDDRLEAEPVGGADAQSANRLVPESGLGAALDEVQLEVERPVRAPAVLDERLVVLAADGVAGVVLNEDSAETLQLWRQVWDTLLRCLGFLKLK